MRKGGNVSASMNGISLIESSTDSNDDDDVDGDMKTTSIIHDTMYANSATLNADDDDLRYLSYLNDTVGISGIVNGNDDSDDHSSSLLVDSFLPLDDTIDSQHNISHSLQQGKEKINASSSNDDSESNPKFHTYENHRTRTPAKIPMTPIPLEGSVYGISLDMLESSPVMVNNNLMMMMMTPQSVKKSTSSTMKKNKQSQQKYATNAAVPSSGSTKRCQKVFNQGEDADSDSSNEIDGINRQSSFPFFHFTGSATKKKKEQSRQHECHLNNTPAKTRLSPYIHDQYIDPIYTQPYHQYKYQSSYQYNHNVTSLCPNYLFWKNRLQNRAMTSILGSPTMKMMNL